MLPVRSLLYLLLLCAVDVHGAGFQAGPGEAHWVAAADAPPCTLTRELGDYGVARFSGAPGQGLHFELLGHRDLFAPGPVPVHGVAPPWSPAFPAESALGTLPHLANGAITVAEPLATTLLMTLYGGLDLRLEQQPWYAPAATAAAPGPVPAPLRVTIPGRSLRRAYGEFVRCLHGAGARSWARMERSRVNYASNEAALTAAHQTRLTELAAFVVGDPSISAVYVDGHTDRVGSREANYRLARERAERVADFLAGAGVPRDRLVVRYHGADYPVAGNDSEDGRARNRRTTVRLERRWQQLAGSGAAADAAVDPGAGAGDAEVEALP